MPKELDEKFLHKLTKHTNLYKPHSNYVDSMTFPEQNVDLLNSKVVLKYRDHRIGDRDIISTPSSGRPSDDGEFIPYGTDYNYKDVVIDDFVYRNKDLEFNKEYKLQIVNLFNDKFKYKNKNYTLKDIIKMYVGDTLNSIIEHKEYVNFIYER